MMKCCFKNVKQWDWKGLRSPDFVLWLQWQIIVGFMGRRLLIRRRDWKTFPPPALARSLLKWYLQDPGLHGISCSASHDSKSMFTYWKSARRLIWIQGNLPSMWMGRSLICSLSKVLEKKKKQTNKKPQHIKNLVEVESSGIYTGMSTAF